MKNLKTAKHFAQLLLEKNTEILEGFKISRGEMPLTIIAASILPLLALLPDLTEAIKEDSQFSTRLIEEYKKLLVKKLGSQDLALVRTATSLSKRQKVKLKKSLQEIFGRPLKMEVEVDEKLIGGLVIKVGHQIIDRSVAGKIEKLKKHLGKLD